MKTLLTVLPLVLLFSCSKAETGGTTPGTKTPAEVKDPKDKGLLDKAKEAMGNVKEGASTPLDDKTVTSLMAIANDLKAEVAKAGGAQGMDMKALMAKAKDLKAVAEKNGMKLSELTGVVTRVTTVMGAIKSGNVPENLKGDVAALEKHKAELQALFQK